MALTPEILVPRLGDVLIEQGLLSKNDLAGALEYQRKLKAEGHATLIGQILVDMGLISRESLDQAITGQILKLQGALEDANKNLEHRVELRTKELEIAYKKLAELSELKSNFVSNISHELRTPLTHIQGYIDLFLSGEEYHLTSDVKQGLQVMQHSADRLKNLINDLINFSTSEVSSLQIKKSIFPLKDQVQKCIQEYTPIARQKNVTLELKWETCEVDVAADKQRIVWVINQLLDNAIKYSNQNGKVVLNVGKNQDDIEISIEDNGIGFDPSQIEDIFEPFRQLDGSSTRKHGGTGIGLALAKKIIEAHDSAITVYSQPGKGSIFAFHLRSA